MPICTHADACLYSWRTKFVSGVNFLPAISALFLFPEGYLGRMSRVLRGTTGTLKLALEHVSEVDTTSLIIVALVAVLSS